MVRWFIAAALLYQPVSCGFGSDDNSAVSGITLSTTSYPTQEECQKAIEGGETGGLAPSDGWQPGSKYVAFCLPGTPHTVAIAK